MTTTQPNVAAQVEAKIAAYLRNYFDPNTNDANEDQAALNVICDRTGTALDGIPIVEAQTNSEYELPCVIVSAGDASPISLTSEASWWNVVVSVMVMTPLAEDVSEESGEQGNSLNATNHAERVGQCAALLNEFPYSEETDEGYPDANIFGWDMMGRTEQQAEKAFVSTFKFNAAASDYFPPS
jgi:hypothetical protein